MEGTIFFSLTKQWENQPFEEDRMSSVPMGYDTNNLKNMTTLSQNWGGDPNLWQFS